MSALDATGGLPAAASSARLQAGTSRHAPAEASHLPGGHRLGHAHQRAGHRLGRLPPASSPIPLAARLSAVRGFARYLQTIEPATESHRPACSPARRHRPPPTCGRPTRSVRLLQAPRGTLPAAAGGHPRGLVRTARRRPACGSARPSALTARRRPRRRASSPSVHAKFDRNAPGSPAPQHHQALRAYAARRDRCAQPGLDSVLRLQRRRAAQPATWPKFPGGSPPPWGYAPARSTRRPRPEAQLRRATADRLAPLRRPRRRTTCRPVHLPRPRQPGRHLLVSVGRPRADGTGRRTARRPLRSRR